MNKDLRVIKRLHFDFKLNIFPSGIHPLYYAIQNQNFEMFKFFFSIDGMKLPEEEEKRKTIILLAFTLTHLTPSNLRFIFEIFSINNYEDIKKIKENRGIIHKICLNPNLDVIKLFDSIKLLNLKERNEEGENGTLISCYKNLNPKVIRYLINHPDNDIHFMTLKEKNCLHLICRSNLISMESKIPLLHLLYLKGITLHYLLIHVENHF